MASERNGRWRRPTPDPASLEASLSSRVGARASILLNNAGLHLTKYNQLGDEGIRVNAVAPGLVATENALADLPASLVEDFVSNRQLIHRSGQISDVVNAVFWLCSEEASFVTGETLRVSGGYPLGV